MPRLPNSKSVQCDQSSPDNSESHYSDHSMIKFDFLVMETRLTICYCQTDFCYCCLFFIIVVISAVGTSLDSAGLVLDLNYSKARPVTKFFMAGIFSGLRKALSYFDTPVDEIKRV